MALPKLLLTPQRDNYSWTPGVTNIYVELDGGAPRVRADKIGANATVSVSWILSNADYNYLMAFYRTAVGAGSLPFTIDLIYDTAELVEYEARFIENGPKLTGESGQIFFVSAQLSITPLPHSEADDLLVLARNDVSE